MPKTCSRWWPRHAPDDAPDMSLTCPRWWSRHVTDMPQIPPKNDNVIYEEPLVKCIQDSRPKGSSPTKNKLAKHRRCASRVHKISLETYSWWWWWPPSCRWRPPWWWWRPPWWCWQPLGWWKNQYKNRWEKSVTDGRTYGPLGDN